MNANSIILNNSLEMNQAADDARSSGDMADHEGTNVTSCPSPIASLFDDTKEEPEEDFWA